MTTTIAEIKGLTKKYIDWVQECIEFEQIGEWIAINTNYLDINNDAIQVYVKKTEHGYLLSDDGFVKSELFLSGLSLHTIKQKELFESVMLGFGIYSKDDVLYKNVQKKEFPFQFHQYIQGILSLLDLFFLSTPKAKLLFYEEVLIWLDKLEIPYNENIKVSGKSGLDHKIDFAFPKKGKKKERLAKILNRVSKSKIKDTIFTFQDIKKSRDFLPFALINDEKGEDLSKEVYALEAYDIFTVPWSQKDKYLQEFSLS